jgi:polar amino acid transport system substrate-binding protein
MTYCPYGAEELGRSRDAWAAGHSSLFTEFVQSGRVLSPHGTADPSRPTQEEVPLVSPRFSASRLLAALACCLLLVALGACGSNDSSSTSASSGGGASTTAGGGSATADPAVAKLVPADIRSKGTITVATDPSYAPNEFVDTDGTTIIGMDVDLANALAGVMGLKADVKSATFDGIIPGLAAGKYDLSLSSFTDTKERERTVDFVTYLTAGTSFFTLADGGADIRTLDDLCGHKVSVEKGTVQQDDAQAQDKKCRDAGKPGVNVQIFPDQNGANLALSSGRAEVGMADSPVAGYQVQQSGGRFKSVGEEYDSAPYGIAIPKDNGLADPVLAALEVLIANGQYRAILTRWGVEDGAISDPAINGATS